MPPSVRERSPQERETLIFPNPEAAHVFKERVAERFSRAPSPSTQQQHGVIADAIAEQFAGAGEGVQLVREPWLHTPAEHAEAQQLVDTAFAQDLGAALKAARHSPHYPRNLDLFHDVLTREMYDLLVQEKVNQQGVGGWLLVLLTVGLLTVLSLLILWVIGS